MCNMKYSFSSVLIFKVTNMLIQFVVNLAWYEYKTLDSPSLISPKNLRCFSLSTLIQDYEGFYKNQCKVCSRNVLGRKHNVIIQ